MCRVPASRIHNIKEIKTADVFLFTEQVVKAIDGQKDSSPVK